MSEEISKVLVRVVEPLRGTPEYRLAYNELKAIGKFWVENPGRLSRVALRRRTQAKLAAFLGRWDKQTN